MSINKQIEEMASIIFESSPIPSVWRSDATRFAELLANAGYRKASDVAREMVEMLTNFFSNDQITRHCEVDAEYINEQIVRIANELMEGKRC